MFIHAAVYVVWVDYTNGLVYYSDSEINLVVLYLAFKYGGIVIVSSNFIIYKKGYKNL